MGVLHHHRLAPFTGESTTHGDHTLHTLLHSQSTLHRHNKKSRMLALQYQTTNLQYTTMIWTCGLMYGSLMYVCKWREPCCLFTRCTAHLSTQLESRANSAKEGVAAGAENEPLHAILPHNTQGSQTVRKCMPASCTQVHSCCKDTS